MSWSLADLYQGLQLLKTHFYGILPYKQTTYFVTTNPSLAPGRTGRVGDFAVLDTVNPALRYEKFGPLDTNWRLPPLTML